MFSRTTVGKEIEKLPITMHITMTLEDWRLIQKAQGDAWPYWQLGGLIQDTIREVTNSVDKLVSSKESE